MNIVVQNKPHRIHEAFTELHHLQELQGGFVALKMDNLVRTCDAVKHAKEPTSNLIIFILFQEQLTEFNYSLSVDS